MARKKLKHFPFHDEKKLVEAAIIFFNKSNVETQKNFYYDPSTKRKRYQVDCLVEKRKTIIEYDGPNHYNNIWKIYRDKQRYKFLKDLGYKVVIFPYYCALTKDMARYIFGDFYSEDKYQEMLEKTCNVKNESEILGPGWHSSKETPANFIPLGIDRFYKELMSVPKSQLDGIIFSLKLYCKDFPKEFIIPNDSRINKLMERNIDENNLKYYYLRRDGKVYI